MCLGCVKDSKDGTCQRKFPKPFNCRRIVGEGLFAEYCRGSPREGGHTGMKWVTPLGMNAEVDNSWVVPYNFHLLKIFDCHINIEYCERITSAKYLFLYISSVRIWYLLRPRNHVMKLEYSRLESIPVHVMLPGE